MTPGPRYGLTEKNHAMARLFTSTSSSGINTQSGNLVPQASAALVAADGPGPTVLRANICELEVVRNFILIPKDPFKVRRLESLLSFYTYEVENGITKRVPYTKIWAESHAALQATIWTDSE